MRNSGMDYAHSNELELVKEVNERSYAGFFRFFRAGVFEIEIIDGERETSNLDFQVLISAPAGGTDLGTRDSATVTIFAIGSGFEEWLNRFFDEAERADPSITGDTADPNHDGLNNLIKYAFGLNPTVSTDRPRVGIAAATEETLTVEYERGTDRTDLKFSFHGSTGLSEWRNLSVLEKSVASLDESTEHVEATLDWPFEYGRSRFVRIAIERATEGLEEFPERE